MCVKGLWHTARNRLNGEVHMQNHMENETGTQVTWRFKGLMQCLSTQNGVLGRIGSGFGE